MGMTIEELKNELEKYPQDLEVYVELGINDIEFDCPISEIYESGRLYIFGKDKFDIRICEVLEDGNDD